ncbi:hypothetical protein [Nonomuraea sp. LPB2021202275-12-8]
MPRDTPTRSPEVSVRRAGRRPWPSATTLGVSSAAPTPMTTMAGISGR